MLIGRSAVEAATDGVSGEVMVFVREAGEEYKCSVEHRNARGIANESRYVPDEFITEGDDNVTDECCKYLLPLIAGENYPQYVNGMPDYIVIK